jgi:S1-C subfamily serine protease
MLFSLSAAGLPAGRRPDLLTTARPKPLTPPAERSQVVLLIHQLRARQCFEAAAADERGLRNRQRHPNQPAVNPGNSGGPLLDSAGRLIALPLQ